MAKKRPPATPPPRIPGRSGAGGGIVRRRRRPAGPETPPLGDAVKTAFAGISAGRWSRMIRADLLPYTPNFVTLPILKVMRDDPQLALGLEVIKSQFHGIEWWLKGGRPEVRSFLETVFFQAPIWDTFLGSVLNCLDFGFQSHELVWAIRYVLGELEGGAGPFEIPRAAVLRKVRGIDPERVDLLVNDFGDLVGLRTDGVSGATLPLDKCLHAVRGFEWDIWHGRSLLRNAYDPWFFALSLTIYLMRYGEQRITPPMKATGPFDVRSAEQLARSGQQPRNTLQLLAEQTVALRNGSVAALPWEDNGHGGNKWNLELIQDQGRVEQFIIALHYMDALKLRALVISDRTLTQDTSVGSNAMAQTHADMTLMSLEKFKRESVITAANEIARKLVRANYNASEPVPVVDSTQFARSGYEAMVALMAKALEVPVTLEDGRTYLPAQLMDFEKCFRVLNVPHKNARSVARQGLPPMISKPGAPPIASPVVKTIGHAASPEPVTSPA